MSSTALVVFFLSASQAKDPRTQTVAIRRRTALAIASVPLVAEVWSRWPADQSRFPPLPPLRPGERHAVVLFGGMDSPDTPVEERTYTRFDMEGRIRAADKAAGLSRAVFEYDWRGALQTPGSSPLASMDNYVRTSHGGQQVGRWVGQQLAKSTSLRTVHVVGASVGAFPADACAAAIVRETSRRQHPTRVRLTLLDPLILRGLLEARYGAVSFGRTADFTEAFLNFDDPVRLAGDSGRP